MRFSDYTASAVWCCALRGNVAKPNRRNQRPHRVHDLLEGAVRDFEQDGPSDREVSLPFELDGLTAKCQLVVWIFEIYQRNVRDQMRMEFGLWSVAAEGYDVSCWLEEWSEVELIIQTSRAMDIILYICRASPMEQIVLHKGARPQSKKV